MGSATLKRGDVVRVAAGKPRPAVVVQADAISTDVEVLLCPLSTTLLDAPLYRPTIQPSPRNALKAPSQLMTDKVGPAPHDKLAGVIGRLDEADVLRLDVALAVVLDLRG